MQTAPPTLAQGSIRNDVCEPRFAPSPHDPKARIHSNYAASPQLNPKDGRPRVLILPNVASWIVGQMAMHIMERFEDRYEFWMLTDKMLRLRPDLVRALLPGLDFIFPLTDKSYKLLRKAAGPLPLPPSIFWVHHVTTWNPSMLAAAHNADELIVCTPEWKTEIEKQCPGSAVTVIPHGVDAHFFHRLPSQRAKFGVPENAFVVGFVGNKVSNYDQGRKGVDTLQVAMLELRRHVPNLHVCFLGLGWDEEVDRYRQQGLSANYTGFIPQSWLPAFYSSIDVHLVSSRIEGGPVTVLEAMACETAVVTTRVGLVPHTIVDGKNGFSTEIGDIEAMVRALRGLRASPQLLARVGRAARAAVYPQRSWGKVLDGLEEPLARMEARSTSRHRWILLLQCQDCRSVGWSRSYYRRTSLGTRELVAGTSVSTRSRGHGEGLLGRLQRRRRIPRTWVDHAVLAAPGRRKAERRFRKNKDEGAPVEPGIMGTAGAANTTPAIEKFLLRTLNFFVHRIKLRLIKPAMKAILPATWLRQIRRHQSRRWDAKFQSQPAVEVFTAIYREAKWGAGPLGDFHSGSGSHDPKIVLPYLEAVRGFLQSLPTAPSLVDLGCGDFNIGRQMRHYCGKYTACDVVPALISRNQIEFSHLNVDFRCLDITHDDLPGADVAVLRQVLQHLSNAQILKIVPSWPGKRRTSRSYSCSPKSDGGRGNCKVPGLRFRMTCREEQLAMTDHDIVGISPGPKFKTALVLAMVADALQIFIFPSFVEGALSPAEDVLDFGVGALLISLLGWHWEFLPSFLAKLVPGVDLVPFWTMAVIGVYRKSKRNVMQAESVQKQSRAELRAPERP